jgi:acyl-CoA synthetase
MNRLLTLHDPAAAKGYYAAGIWQFDTLYSLLRRHARTRPRAFALRDASVRLTWAELLGWVDAVAEDLHRSGVRHGERVAVWLPNRVEAIVVLLACSRNGYVCNPSLHQNYRVAEIMTLLERIDAAALFAQTGYGADAERADVFAAAGELASLRGVYRLEPHGANRPAQAAQASFPGRDNGVAASVPPDPNPDKVIYLAFTSGTTGTPKGVMHSDNTLLTNGRAMVRDWGHDEHTVLLSLSPMSHHIGTVALEQTLVAGCELVVNDPAAGKKPVDWIVEAGATYVMGVPTHAMDILAELNARGMQRLGKVRVFYMAGASIPRETAQGFLDRGILPQNVYGMTENGSHQYTLPTDEPRTIVETCGRACRGYEIRIFRQDHPDLEAAPGEIGEIGGRGGCLTLGYFDNQMPTERAFNAAGWFMGGDLGRLDKRGCLQILGRKKDLIIRGGHNIHPAHIEDLAHRHPQVVKAAAFPVADARLGERACLAIIPAAGGAAPDADEILAHLDGAGLSKYDMPEYFIAMEAFPLTASGKILKRELVEWVRSGRIAPAPCRFAAKPLQRNGQD